MNKILLEKKRSADRAWDVLFERMQNGDKVDKDTLAAAMERCNAIDREIMEEKEKMTKYLKERENCLYPSNKSIGDIEIDELMQKYIEQFQYAYSKDISEFKEKDHGKSI